MRARRGDATMLKLRGNRFGMAGAAALFAEMRPVVTKPAWPRLKHLDLEGTPIGLDGYPQLCGAITAKHMPQLQALLLEEEVPAGLSSDFRRVLRNIITFFLVHTVEVFLMMCTYIGGVFNDVQPCWTCFL